MRPCQVFWYTEGTTQTAVGGKARWRPLSLAAWGTRGWSLTSLSAEVHRAVSPPSTTRVAPVMNDDSSLARNTAAFANSSG